MSDLLKQNALLRLSAELHLLRRLASVKKLDGLAADIDAAALHAAELSDIVDPPISDDPNDTPLFYLLSHLRRLKSRSDALGIDSVSMLIDQAIDEANAERNKLKASSRL